MWCDYHPIEDCRVDGARPCTDFETDCGCASHRKVGEFSEQILSLPDEPHGGAEQPTATRGTNPHPEEVLMKKVSYLLASAVSALAATLPVSSMASTPDLAVRDPSAATELARPADVIKVSQAAKDQIGAKARGLVQYAAEEGRPGLGFGEEIPQVRRHPGPGFVEWEEIPQVRRIPPMFGEEIPSVRRAPGLSFGEEIPQRRPR